MKIRLNTGFLNLQQQGGKLRETKTEQYRSFHRVLLRLSLTQRVKEIFENIDSGVAMYFAIYKEP